MRAPCIALLAILVLAATSATGRAAADAPRWAVGDFWEYDVETVVEAGLVLNGTVRATVSDFGTRTVTGAAMRAFTTILSGGGSVHGPENGPHVDGRWSYAGEQWVEAAGFKVVRSVVQIDANGTAPPFGFSFQVQNTSENEVVSDTWRYPIDVGTTGTLVTNTTATERVRIRYGLFTEDSTAAGTYLRTVALLVAGASEVRAEAGTFSSLEVRVAWPSGDVDTWFYAPAIGNNARTESRNATGAKIAASSLRSYRYQAGDPPFPLGLSPPIAAALIGGIVAGAAVAILVLRRRRRSRDAPDPTVEPPRAPPST